MRAPAKRIKDKRSWHHDQLLHFFKSMKIPQGQSHYNLSNSLLKDKPGSHSISQDPLHLSLLSYSAYTKDFKAK
ncbi:hypothetical protein PBF_14599 [Cytobacillus firmus DS1]|uniref:Uncharacterized protein n=1 Tax=Cytobacillus firmus DS1 TaxID=1307436 RepID=W7L445_CYTFI|nr:hypothetical protein PBF_14599 [Cytobacillus firmus DS1]